MWDPLDLCPGCGAKGSGFATHFKKFGAHRMVACLACRSVWVDGKRVADLVVTMHPA